MSWRQTTIGFLADALRFLIRGLLFIDLIMVSVFSVWFTARFLLQLGKWATSHLFSSNW